jgi:hypothetical protein
MIFVGSPIAAQLCTKLLLRTGISSGAAVAAAMKASDGGPDGRGCHPEVQNAVWLAAAGGRVGESWGLWTIYQLLTFPSRAFIQTIDTGHTQCVVCCLAQSELC